ncbi:NYN domain-containing protein [Longimicrobium sp.]|uniref:NYN domain-containing protein n=1 Tax=Longimicrobium sp. TaxID=2029185 RepID=UPI002C1F7B80|nr:NYN domain-containing protein [Longimicrobium sp.]HSU17306.1 NYN domain-containing protein [Longimicrobium sp.]
MNKRISFLVDGFNVYHSLRQVEQISGQRVKWLDLDKLLTGYLSAIRGKLGGGRVELGGIYYFSALATHLTGTDRGVVNRHATYISALESTGVSVVLSKFKVKDFVCPACKHRYKRHEEKETDVAIGLKLVEAFVRDEADAVVIVSGDSDLMPAVRTARGLFPHGKIGVAFPFNRHTTELEQATDFSWNISQRDIQRAQFPLQVKLADGTLVEKPASW